MSGGGPGVVRLRLCVMHLGPRAVRRRPCVMHLGPRAVRLRPYVTHLGPRAVRLRPYVMHLGPCDMHRRLCLMHLGPRRRTRAVIRSGVRSADSRTIGPTPLVGACFGRANYVDRSAAERISPARS